MEKAPTEATVVPKEKHAECWWCVCQLLRVD